MKTNIKLIALTFLLSVSILGGSLAFPQNAATALTGSEFQAGRIMDDGVFYNPNGMTEAQIQEFLNAKNPACDTNGQQTIFDSAYGDTVTRATYSQRRGVSPPFVCLKDYSHTTGNKVPEAGLCNGHVAGSFKPAARIIYEVAQSCGVNPKVLIILLQKEQSLITDTWPWPVQYRSATGYGCPDTAPCDAEYYGFFNQLYAAARVYKYYAKFPSSFNHVAGRNNFVLYNPNSACGGSTVFINNQATAGLYNYTPYQPNAAALNNLYGTGDGCSAYGNRNFWRMYNDWFGSTFAPVYSAQPVWQSVFTDSSKATSLGWNATLVQGRSAHAVVQMRNTGNITWTRSGANETRMATHSPWGRQSLFCTAGWLATNPACTRAAVLAEASVAPGQVGTFEFPITAPQQPGVYNEGFGLVIDGASTFSNGVMNFQFTVEAERNSAQPVWQSIFTDSSKTAQLGWGATLLPGQSAYAVVAMKNTGNIAWTRTGGSNDTMLVTVNSQDRLSRFCTGSWLYPCSRPARLIENSVAPGQTGTFEFPITAPQQPGLYNEAFGLVVNGRGFFSNGYMSFPITVEAERNSAQPVWQSIFTDSSKTTSLGWGATVSPGQSAYAVVVMKNTGNIAWTRTGGSNDTMLGSVLSQDRQSPFCTNAWLYPCSRPVRLLEASVAPGQSGTFEFPITAPNQLGTYSESFGLVVNGKGFFGSGYMTFKITVN